MCVRLRLGSLPPEDLEESLLVVLLSGGAEADGATVVGPVEMNLFSEGEQSSTVSVNRDFGTVISLEGGGY